MASQENVTGKVTVPKDLMTFADFKYIGKPKAGQTYINIKFKTFLKDPMVLILYGTFPETMETDQVRNITLQEKEIKCCRV